MSDILGFNKEFNPLIPMHDGVDGVVNDEAEDEDDFVTLVVDGGVESRIDVSATQGREQHSPTAERS